MIKQKPHLRVLFTSTHQGYLTRVFFAVLDTFFRVLLSVFLTPVISYTRACTLVRVAPAAPASAHTRTRGLVRVRACIRAITRASRVLTPKIATGLAVVAVIVSVGFGLMHSAGVANAAPADTLNFQARLENADGAIANDGNYNIQFKLYTAASGGAPIWTETYLNSNNQGIRVVNGYVSVYLGSISGLPASGWDQSMYVTMNIGGTSTSVPTYDGEMNPRLKLTAVPYAFQAKSASQLQVSNGPNVATLGFVTPTANNTILLPNASGTLCLANSATCGFASSAGSSNYIQNGTALQAGANFNIQTGAAGDPTGVIQAVTGQTADLFQLRNAAGDRTGGFNAAGNLYFLGGNFSGTIIQDAIPRDITYHLPVPNTGASDVYLCLSTGNCAGSGNGITGSGLTNRVARFDTNNTISNSSLLYDDGNYVGVNTILNGGAALNVSATNSTQAGIFIQAADNSSEAGLVIKLGAAPDNGGGFLQLKDATGAVLTSIDANGKIVTSGGLQVSGAAAFGNNLSIVGSAAVQGADGITLGKSNTTNGQLTFLSGANGFKTTLVSPVSTADRTLTIPNTGADDVICLRFAGNCAGSGGGITGAGTQYRLARFTTLAGNYVGDSSVYDDGSFVGIGTTSNSGLLSLMGTSPNQPTLFAQSAASATTPVAVIKGGATPTTGADLLQLQKNDNSVVASFDQNGNFTTTGSVTVGNGLVVTAGGANITGTTNINTAGTGATNIGNSSSNFNLNSTGLNVTTSGALSGITGYTQNSGNFTVNGSGTITLGSLGAGIVQSSSTGVLSSGILSRNNNTVLSDVLTVANGGTGAGSFTANGIVYGNGTDALQATASANNSILVTDASGLPSLSQTLPTAVQGNITNVGALSAGSIANGFGTINTANNITTSATLQGNIVNASGAGAELQLNGQNINSNGTLTNVAYLNATSQSFTGIAQFTGSGNVLRVDNDASIAGTLSLGTLAVTNDATISGGLTVTGSGGLVAGVAGTTAGSLTFFNSSNGKKTVLQGLAANGQDQIITIPASTAATDTVCLYTLKNCSTANSITGAGTAGYVARFDTNSTLATGLLYDNGSSLVGVNTTTNNGTLSLKTVGTQTGFYVEGAATGVNPIQVIKNGGSTGDFLDFIGSGNTTVAKIDNNGVLYAAGANITGQIRGTYSGTNGSGITAATTNSSTTGNAAVNGVSIGLTGTNTTGTNTNTALNLASVTAKTNNTFIGLNFGTGYNSLISYNGTEVLSGTGQLNLAQVYGTLGVANGGTGATSLTSNGILFGNGTGAVQATAAAANSILITDGSNNPSLSQTLPMLVQGNITQVGALSAGSIGAGFGSINTGNAISTTAGVTGNTVNASGTGAALQLNGTSINVAGTLSNVAYLNQANSFTAASNTFTGNLNVQGSGGVNVGVSGTTDGAITLNSGSSLFTTTIKSLTPSGQSQTIVIPATTNPSGNDTVCLLSLANCGTAGAILGSGTQNYIARFDTSGNHLGNSLLYDNSSFIGLNTTTNSGLLSIVGSSASQSSFFVQQAANAITAAAVIKGGATPAAGGNLLELQSSTGAVLARVDKTGVLYASGVDAATASALEIGATNATAINLNKNTTITGASTLTTGTGAVKFGSLGAGIVQSSADGTLSSGTISRNSATYFTDMLNVANGGTGAATFTSNGLLFGNGTGALQATAAGTNGQILQAGTGGTPSFVSLSGDATIATGGAITVNKLQGNTVTITTPTSGQYLRYDGTAFVNSALQTSDITGTLFTLAGSTGTNQAITVGSTVSILKGASNNLTTTAGNTNQLTIDIVSNPSFSGTITSTSATTGLALTGVLAPSTTASLLQLGSVIAGGNANGTYVGINQPAGSTADFANFQTNGASQFRIGSGGSVFQNGALTVQSGGAAITGNSTITGTLSGLTGLASSGTITFSSLGSGLVSSANGTLSAGALDRNSATYFNTTLSVANGGTGAATFATNGLLYGNATGALQATTAGTVGQMLFAGTGGTPIFATLGGDLTSSTGTVGQVTVNKLQGNNLSITTPTTGQYIRYNGTAFVNSAIQASDLPDLGGTYIKNGVSQQTTANFNIQAATGTVAAKIQGASSQDIIDFVTSGGTTAAKIDSTGALTAAGATFNGSVNIAAGNSFTNASSTLLSALTINDLPAGGSVGSKTTTVDVATTLNINQTTAGQNITLPSPTVSTGGRILYINNVGTAMFTIGSVILYPGASASYIWNGVTWVALTTGSSNAGVTTIGGIDSQPKAANGAVIGGSSLYLQTADASNPGLVSADAQTIGGVKTFNSKVVLAGNDAGISLAVTNGVTIGGTLRVSGTSQFDGNVTISGANSLTVGTGAVKFGSLGAGIVQSSSDGTLSSGAVDRNSSTVLNGTLNVSNGGTGANSFTTNGILFGNNTGALQATSAGTAGQLLFAGTGGTPAFATLGGDLTSSATTVGSVKVSKLQGYGLDLTTTAPTTGKFLRYDGTNFVASGVAATDVTGTLFTLAGSTGTNQNVSAGSTVSILRGSSSNLTSVASSANTITIDIIQNPTFTGTISATNSTTGLALNGGLTATTASSLLQLGAAISGGSANGTYVGINQPAGGTADFENYQINGVNKFKVSSTGATTQADKLTVSANGIAVTGNSTVAGTLTGLTGLTSSGTVTFSGLGNGLVTSASGTLSSGALDRNNATYFNTALSVANGGTGATTFTSNGLLYGNAAGALQATAAGTSGQILQANASGVPTFVTQSGDVLIAAGGATTINKLQGSTLTISTPTAGQVVRYNGSAFVNSAITAADVTGTLFTLQGSTGSAQAVAAGSTVSVLAGTSGNITSVASATNTITVDITQAPTFTGTISANNSTTGLALNNGLTASTSSSLLQLGAAISGGSAAGTYFGTNQPAGGTADFINLQVAGASRFKVSSTGATTQADKLTVSANGIAVTGNSTISGTLGSLTGLSSSGAITFSGLGAGLVQAGTGGALTSGAVDRNNATYFNTALSVANGGTGAATFTSNGLIYGNAAGALQATAAGTAGQIAFAGTGGVPGFATLGGDLSASTSTVGNVTVNKLQGFGLSITSPAAGQVVRYNGTNFVNASLTTADVTGTLFTLKGSTGADQAVAVGANVSILAGVSGNITSVASATNTITVDITQAPTFTGTISANNSTTGLALNNGLTATSSSSLLQLGAAISGGSANGTYVGINQPSGGTADFTNFQVAGASKFKVSSTGATTQADKLTVSANGIAVTGNSTIAGTLTGLTGLTTSGTVTLSGLGAGLVQAGTGGTLTSGTVDRNSASFFNTTLSVANGGTGATTFASNGVLFGNAAGALQATAAGTSGQILQANASGTPTFVTQSGDVSIAAGGATTINKLQGSTLTITTPTAGQVVRYNGSAFVNSSIAATDLSGTLFTLKGSTGTDQLVNAGSTVSVLAGTSGNITSVASATNTITVDITQAPTFTGKLTLSATAGQALDVSGLPSASATQSLIKVGNAAIAGGNANGTFIGLNTSAATTADLINLQNNGTSEFRVGATGSIFANGGLTIQSGGITAGGAIKFTSLNSVGVVSTSADGTLSTGPLDRNSATLQTGTLSVANGGTGAATFTSKGLLYGNGAGALQATAVGTAGQQLFADTDGTPVFKSVTGDLTASTTSVGSVSVSKLQGYTLDLTTTAPTSGQYLRYNGTKFVAGGITATDVTGTLFTLKGTSGTDQAVTTGSTVSILRGASGNLTSTASATNTITLDIIANPTFSNILLNGTGPRLLDIATLPTAVNNNSIVKLGDVAIVNGSANGTFIGLNTSTATTADYMNFQNNGVSKFSVSSTGATTIADKLTVSANGIAVTGNSTVAGTLTGLTGLTSAGAVKFTGLNSVGVVSTAADGTLSTAPLDRNSATLQTGTLSVANGGTGAANFAANGILYGNGTSALGVTTSVNDAILATNATTGVPSLVTTLPVTVQGNITKLGTVTSGQLGVGFGAINTQSAISTNQTLQGNIVNASTGFTVGGVAAVAGKYLRSDGTNFVSSSLLASDLSGTLFNITGSTGTAQPITTGNTVTIARGTSNNLTTSASGTTLTVDIVGNPTFGGTITGQGTSGLILSANPLVSTTAPLLQMGGALVNGGANGTYLGINQPGSGVGSTADFLNFQTGGAYKLKVGNSGLVDSAVGFAVNGVAGTSQDCSTGGILSNAKYAGGILIGGTCSSTNSVINLQTAYNNSGGSNPQIQLDSANGYGGLKIADSSAGVTGNLFQLTNFGGGTTYFGVSKTAVTINNALNVNGAYTQQDASTNNFSGQTKFNGSGIAALIENGSLKISNTGSGGVGLFQAYNDGTVLQTFASSTTSSAYTLTATNTNAGTGSSTLRVLNITLPGTANSAGGSNVTYGLNLGAPATALAGNTFYGINYTGNFNGGLLALNGTALIDKSGYLQNAAIDSTQSYSNLNKVGALSSGSIIGGFGAINTTNNISTTAKLQGNSLEIGNSPNYDKFSVDTNGNTLNLGSFKVGATQQFAVDSNGNLVSKGTVTLNGTAQTQLVVSTAPTAGGTTSLIQLGSTIASFALANNAVGTGGTYLSVNTPGTGAGSTADFLNLQSNNALKVLISNNGNIYTAGNLTVAPLAAETATNPAVNVTGTVSASTAFKIGANATATSLTGNTLNFTGVGTVSANAGASTLAINGSNFKVDTSGYVQLLGGLTSTPDITTATAGTATGISIKPGATTATATGGALNLNGGDVTTSTGSTGGAVNIQGGKAATAGTRFGGNVNINGGDGNGGTNGKVIIGGATTGGVDIGTGANAVPLTVYGSITQSFTSAATGTSNAYATTVKNANTSSTATTVNAVNLTLDANATGTNNVTNGIVLNAGAAYAGNTYNGIILNGTFGGNLFQNGTNYVVTGGGAVTQALGLTVNSGGANVTGASQLQGGLVKINDSSNNATQINTGTSTGTVSIGNANAGAITIQSGNAINLTAGAASTFNFGTNALTVTTSNLNLSGTLTLGAVGTANTTNYVCRNSTNQLAACSTTGVGAMFVQGGNSFGADAVLGTNDAFNLSFRTGNANRATLDQTGNLTFQQASTIQAVSGANLTVQTQGAGILTLNGASGGIVAQASGNISVAASGTATLALDTNTGSIAIGTGNTVKAITVGSVIGSSATTLQAGTGNLNLRPLGSGDTGAVVRPYNNSTNAFQVQNADASRAVLSVDTTNLRVRIGSNTALTPSTLTLFQFDRSNGNPGANSAFLGSMYFDTAADTFQCYNTSGWGACGAAPNVSVNLVPEYQGLVLNGTGVGTLTSNICTNVGALSGANSVNSTNGDQTCANGESYNYYKWTSPQATNQTYSLYVRYQLPATFKNFNDDNTIKINARVTDTANAKVAYSMYNSSTGAQCGTTTDVTTNAGANTWSIGSAAANNGQLSGNETSCNFLLNDIILFKIDVTAKSGASAYVGNLSFLTVGK